jgi:hypothetical protein
MVKIVNSFGDIKTGKQGEVVYQRHYGLQVRRLCSPKSTTPSLHQTDQRTRFQQALQWRATLSLPERRFLEGYAIAHRIVDSYGVVLSWDKFANKIALETPKLTIL